MVQGQVAPEDRREATEVLERFDRGFLARDACEATAGYADDAEWMNAFGVRKTGRAEIRAFFESVWAQAHTHSYRVVRTGQAIRFLQTDVAIAWGSWTGDEQRTHDGELLPPRVGNDLRILTKRDGRWQIASHMIMDEARAAPTMR